MATEDTVENTETPQPGNGNPEATPTATVPEPSAEETQQEKVDRAEYERLQKEHNKALQRINQQENQRKKEQEEALAEQGKYKELYEQTQAQIEAREEQERLVRLRDEAIASFEDEGAKKIAQNLISKNPNALFWGEAQDETDAIAQVHAQMEAFKGATQTSSTETTPEPPIDGNNGLPAEQPLSTETREERMKRFEEENANKVILPAG